MSRFQRQAFTATKAGKSASDSSSGHSTIRLKLARMRLKSLRQRKSISRAGPISRMAQRTYLFISQPYCSLWFRPLETQAGDLLGDQAEQKDYNPAKEEDPGGRRYVQPAIAVGHRPEVRRQRQRFEGQKDREKDPQRAE